ncbi:MAG: hypothetical protein NC337_04535 [Roseburia sp.]|nr:hypothetical protein [Roseburia sp.]
MKNVIVFGIGKNGQKAVHWLKNKYRILFVTDNEQEKWGSAFEGYVVKAPNEILQYDCNIVITPTNFYIDILYQLLQMGVDRDRIYLGEGVRINDSFRYEVYPLDAQKIDGTEKELVQHDLLNNKEQSTGYKKILIIYSFYSVYTKQLIENMAKRYNDIEISLLTSEQENKDKIDARYLKHIYFFQTKSDIKTILAQLPVYDVMQVLWIENVWSYFYKVLRNKTRKLYLNVGGSEFYRASRTERDFKRKLIACSDKVTAETEETVREFQDYYSDEIKGQVGFLPFGIEVLDFINSSKNQNNNEMKRKYHIPLDKFVVTCGHNASEAHQHMDIIDALCNLQDDEKQKIVCVFPMTYNGSKAYIEKVRCRLDKTGLEYVVLTEFMDFQSMAEYALISDIMIHVQTTDQLSSTMLEEMYAGSVVIAGSWLPYRSLHEMGIYFLDVDTIPDVTAVLEDVVANPDIYKERCGKNAELVWNHSSWDVLAPKWRALWD